MTADEQGSAAMHDHQSGIDEKTSTDHVVSAARRRALKIGLASVPIILTLRSKSAFGATCTPSLMASATRASHVTCTLPPPSAPGGPTKSGFEPTKK